MFGLVGSQSYLEVVDAFLQASLDAAAWTPALAALASATRSSHGQLIGIGGPRAVPFNLVDLPDASKAEFVAIDGGDPSVNPRVALGRAGVLRSVAEPDYDAVRPTLRTDAYLEFEQRYDIPNGCQSTLVLQPDLLVGLAVLRSRRDGRCSPEDRALFDAVAPHVRSAVKTQLALGGEGAQLIAGALEATGVAAFIFDSAGRVCAVTAPAERLVVASDVLSLSGGELTARADGDNARLQAAIGRAAGRDPGQGEPPPPAELVLRGVGPLATPTILHISALPRRPWAFGFLPRGIVVVRTATDALPSVTLLAAAYRLTEAEADVARLLCSGVSREVIAGLRRVSVDTVRSQLKSIFQKAGVRREAELLSLLRRLASF